jgi:6-phosphofructokinase 1
MGRNAGHLALGIGKAAGATITLIGEEFKDHSDALNRAADMLTGSIIKRLSMGRDHGVAVLAEGISSVCPIDELAKYDVCELDETGRVRLSEIQLGRVLKNFVRKTLDEMGIKITIVDKRIGYELRAADPIPYDVEYTRNLGYGAIRYLLRGGSGAMIVFDEGNLRPIPFVELIDHTTGRTKVRTVDIMSATYEVARKYMIRLEKEDFEGDNLKKLAKIAHMTPEAFKERFGYLFP